MQRGGRCHCGLGRALAGWRSVGIGCAWARPRLASTVFAAAALLAHGVTADPRRPGRVRGKHRVHVAVALIELCPKEVDLGLERRNVPLLDQVLVGGRATGGGGGLAAVSQLVPKVGNLILFFSQLLLPCVRRGSNLCCKKSESLDWKCPVQRACASGSIMSTHLTDLERQCFAELRKFTLMPTLLSIQDAT